MHGYIRNHTEQKRPRPLTATHSPACACIGVLSHIRLRKPFLQGMCGLWPPKLPATAARNARAHVDAETHLDPMDTSVVVVALERFRSVITTAVAGDADDPVPQYAYLIIGRNGRGDGSHVHRNQVTKGEVARAKNEGNHGAARQRTQAITARTLAVLRCPTRCAAQSDPPAA